MKTTEMIKQQLTAAINGDCATSFKDPAATALVRSMATLSPRELYEIGLITVSVLLDRQLASAHAEREIRLMRDRSQPLC